MSASSLVIIVQVLSGFAIWKPVQFSELAALFGSFQGARLAHFIGMAADRRLPRRPCRAGAAGAEDHRRDDHRRPGGRRRRRPTTAHQAPLRRPWRIQTALAVDLPPARAGSIRACWTSNKALIARDRPPQDPARRAQPRRADHAHRLQRHAHRRGAVACCTRVSQFNDRVQELMFRPNHLAPTFTGGAGASSRRASMPITTSRTSSRSTCANWKLELAGLIARQAALDGAADLRACRSRNGSSATSASRAGTISANGPA